MRELKRNRTDHNSRTETVNHCADSLHIDLECDTRYRRTGKNLTRERYLTLQNTPPIERMGAPSLGKAAKLESRPENADRANPELRALGHQTPGRAEWGKKTRTRQNGSSREQQSRSSPERGMGEKRARTSHGQTKSARADRKLNGRP